MSATKTDELTELARVLDDTRERLRPLLRGDGLPARTARRVWVALADASDRLVEGASDA